MASRTPARPRSPHLFSGFLKLHYSWGPHMLVSILHRATGSAMATVGTVLLVWWLAAIASGAEAYARFRDVFTTDMGHLNIVGWVIGVGMTYAFFTHMLNGVRHLVMDAGAAFELKRNKMFSLIVIAGGIVLTVAFWLYLGIK
ncbi:MULTISPECIES: succinate dehydrogenase, cytochrome b556 subunit [Sphingomonas]|uniref:Succinate dehydrogenase cytochrome b556 subunit n=1 Tax=Sphingomonas kyungheensis TaxID=1069987 RepID=A0ABU8H0L7_9SPHN|nr:MULTISPECIES: succinate dehydrogenase, cytochrome b556 subunit [unclassified Sphingomonas]EZP56560.1 Succinate dehydrogenase, cytochrome b556 subunit [Sphingomonas sp. RIT328]